MLHFRICFTNFSNQTHDCLFEPLQETRGNNLKEYEAVFLKRQKLIFSIARNSSSISGIISFFFVFD